MLKAFTINILLPVVFIIFLSSNSSNSISGTVYIDKNRNGIFDAASDQLCAAIPIQIYEIEGNKLLKSSSTNGSANSSGRYLIENLSPGKSYKILFVFPKEYFAPEYGLSSVMPSNIIAKCGDANADFVLTPSK